MEQDWCWDTTKKYSDWKNNLDLKKKFRGREFNSEFQWGRMSYWYGDTKTCLLIKQGEQKELILIRLNIYFNVGFDPTCSDGE